MFLIVLTNRNDRWMAQVYEVVMVISALKTFFTEINHMIEPVVFVMKNPLTIRIRENSAILKCCLCHCIEYIKKFKMLGRVAYSGISLVLQ